MSNDITTGEQTAVKQVSLELPIGINGFPIVKGFNCIPFARLEEMYRKAKLQKQKSKEKLPFVTFYMDIEINPNLKTAQNRYVTTVSLSEVW